LIFLLSGPVLAGQIQDRPAGPITSSEAAIDISPSEESFVNPASLDIISHQREKFLMDRALLNERLDNLSAAHSQKCISIVSNPPEGSNPDLQIQDPDPGDYLENRLHITVKGISVRAINTMERGKATATSNIIIEPVQIIKVTPQATDKLR